MRILKFDELHYSTISIAELGFKAKSRMLSFGKSDIERWQDLGMAELPFGRSSAIEFASFHSHQVPDPIDRQIMAVARANGLGLITADRKILSLQLDWVIDATT
jgi:PIN domain nuclease of toxin-antitoxin system